MSIGVRAYNVLKEISYERLGGTKEEFQSLKTLQREVEAEGVECFVEDFEVDSFEIEVASLKVTKPEVCEYKVNAYGMCSSTPAEGVTGEFVYVESQKLISQMNLENKIVLTTNPLGYQLYEDLIKAKVSFLLFGV